MKSDAKHGSELLTDVARAIGSSLGTVVGKTTAFTSEVGRTATKVSRPKAASRKTRKKTGRARSRVRGGIKVKRKRP